MNLTNTLKLDFYSDMVNGMLKTLASNLKNARGNMSHNRSLTGTP